MSFFLFFHVTCSFISFPCDFIPYFFLPLVFFSLLNENHGALTTPIQWVFSSLFFISLLHIHNWILFEYFIYSKGRFLICSKRQQKREKIKRLRWQNKNKKKKEKKLKKKNIREMQTNCDIDLKYTLKKKWIHIFFSRVNASNHILLFSLHWTNINLCCVLMFWWRLVRYSLVINRL